MKPKLLLFILGMCAGTALHAQKVTDRFIEKYLPVAKDIKNDKGIPISIVLGVSAWESGSGTSLNAKQLNNFFGIKGKNSLKKRRTAYKQFSSANAAFLEFAEMVTRTKYYPKLKDDMDYHKWLKAMNSAGYAGAKQAWIKGITGVIKKFNLALYDK